MIYYRNTDKVKRPKVGLGCLILRKNKEDGNLFYLVGIRKSSHGAGLYSLPGGHLEYGESWQECAYKEALEETNLNIAPNQWRFAFVNNSISPAKNPKDDPLHYVDIIMSCMYAGENEPINNEPDKCQGWEWVKWDAHNLDQDKLFCGTKTINDISNCVSFDQWKELN